MSEARLAKTWSWSVDVRRHRAYSPAPHALCVGALRLAQGVLAGARCGVRTCDYEFFLLRRGQAHGATALVNFDSRQSIWFLPHGLAQSPLVQRLSPFAEKSRWSCRAIGSLLCTVPGRAGQSRCRFRR